MAEETTDKSIVVWHPRLIKTISDASELTSLCLFHDQVIFYSLYFNNKEKPKREEQIMRYWERKPDFRQRVDFMNTIQLLIKQRVINLIMSNDYQKIVNNFTKMGAKIPQTLWASRNNFWKSTVDTGTVKNFEKQIEWFFNALDSVETQVSYMASKAYCYPLVTNYAGLQTLDGNKESTEKYSGLLAQSAICQLALPDVKAAHVEDLLEARTELKNELLEFRAGILKLTWLLHHQIQNKTDLEEIRHEAGVLTNTVIKGSLLSLENRMRQHKNKRIRRMLFGTRRVLVEATKLFLPGGATEKMIAGGKSLFQLATELDSAKPPEDQVAMYLYKLKRKFKTNATELQV